MKLLNQLIKINELPAKDKKQLAKLVLTNNAAFASYLTLCYTGDPRNSINVNKIKYRPTESPMGLDYGSLESVYNKFYQSIYDPNEGMMTDERAERNLIQIFEIISEVEVEFLKQIIKGKYKGLTKLEFEKTLTPIKNLV